MEIRQVLQECSCCGKQFMLTYWLDGSYTYTDEPCDCAADFHPANPGDPSISEWMEQAKRYYGIR